jgi:hypothetical protein
VLSRLFIPLLLALAFVPAFAGSTASPVGAPCQDIQVHAYYVQPVGAVHAPAVHDVGCSATSDARAGLGQVFLNADHHALNVCMSDRVFADVQYRIAIDGNGDGLISDSDPADLSTPWLSGCSHIPFHPGDDGGWWILLGPKATEGYIITR